MDKRNRPCILRYLYRKGRRKNRRRLGTRLQCSRALCVSFHTQTWSASATSDSSYISRQRCQKGNSHFTFAQVTVFARFDVSTAGVVRKIALSWASVWFGRVNVELLFDMNKYHARLYSCKPCNNLEYIVSNWCAVTASMCHKTIRMDSQVGVVQQVKHRR